MTTNLGQPHFLDTTSGRARTRRSPSRRWKRWKTYRSEFLNRFAGRQNIICFNTLGSALIEKIVAREFDSYRPHLWPEEGNVMAATRT